MKKNNRTTEEATRRMGIGLILLGSLVMKMPEGEGDGLDLPTILFGTVNGVIGVITTLPEDLFLFCDKLSEILLKVIHGVGGLSHAE